MAIARLSRPMASGGHHPSARASDIPSVHPRGIKVLAYNHLLGLLSRVRRGSLAGGARSEISGLGNADAECPLNADQFVPRSPPK